MEKQQLYARGKPFSPETNAEDISALDIYGITGHQENTLQALLDRIADQVANRLIKKTEIAEWAKQEEKPPYTPGEVGADPSGSAGAALGEAKAYADTIRQLAAAYTDEEIAGLINGAPGTLDTLKEIADAMAEHNTVAEAIQAAIGSKAGAAELEGHTSDQRVHITEDEHSWIEEAIGKLEGIAEGATRIMLTKSLAATEEGFGVDAVAIPAIIERINSVNSSLSNSIGNIEKSFRDGCSAIMAACQGQGIAPASNSPSHISAAIAAIASSKYNAGVAAADARANPASANWQNGRAQGRADITGNPNAYGLYTNAQYDAYYNAGHNAGYNAGVTAADARANPDSANWQSGRAQGQADITGNPNAYGLYTQEQYNANYTAGASQAQINGTASARLIKSYSRQMVPDSIDIKPIYANYTALSANNFIVRVSRVDTQYYASNADTNFSLIGHTYNPAEGILTLNISNHYRNYYYTCDVLLVAP